MFDSNQFFGGERGFYPLQIEQSLRLNDDDSAYLSRTPASAGNRRTWTFSWWFKPSMVPTGAETFFSAAYSYQSLDLNDNNTGQIRLFLQESPGYYYTWTPKYRDPSAWYHGVLRYDTTQATDTNRVRLYINGEEVTDLTSVSRPPQNWEGGFNNSIVHRIGVRASPTENYYDGYMAEINFVDGQSLAPSSFGETKSGVWIPKEYTGSYGTNGFHLQFAGNANDSSGNSNNWTANNISSYDYMPDSPTNNFATWNPLASSNISSTQGNLRATTASAGSSVLSSIATPTSGKWYAEFICTAKSSSGVNIGVTPSEGAAMTESFTEFSNVGGTNGYGWYNDLGRIYYGNGTYDTYDTTYAVGDIIGVALDVDNGTVIWSKNGTAQSTYTRPSAGISYYFAAGEGQGSATATIAANFGQDSTFQGYTTAGGNSDANGYGDFKYAPPSGYLALCTANLPDPVIDPAQGSSPEDYFNTVLYTGNGTSGHSITGVGFEPSFVWLKERADTSDHHLFDQVRGLPSFLVSNKTDAENTTGSQLLSFDSDGFTLNSGGGINENTQPVVAWNWKANGTGVSNNVGSITSTVSANTTSGFSIVSYTGTGSNATVGHGLDSAPEFVILKNRDTATQWVTWHTGMSGPTYYMYLTTNAEYPYAPFWPSAPTNSVINIGTDQYVNYSGEDYIAYCFHSVEGYSRFTSYVGNGSSDGVFVYLGFKPKFTLVKRTDSTDDWYLRDAERDVNNPTTQFLEANTSNAEGTGVDIDYLSNGIKIRGTGVNASGGTYIIAAFAEQPFKYSTAR